MVDREKINPPIKYPGGKRFLVDHIQILWNLSKSRRLVEPFSGGMAISLGIGPKKALLNDINPHVINFYRSVQNGFSIDIEMQNDEAFYYSKRKQFNDLITANLHETDLAASLFYYLNRTGYNGLIRFNRSGLYNVPFGRYKKINYRRSFPEVQQRIKHWKLEIGDFSRLKINKTDFLYVDPPYDVQFRSYSGNSFAWEEQERLVSYLSSVKCPVVISNQATDRVVNLYEESGYKVIYIDAPRMISCKGDRTRAQEVLALRNMTIEQGFESQ